MPEPERQEIQRTLAAVTRGEPGAAEQLLPLVYGQLRKLAQARMAHLPPGNTLQPTALVHEAYMRVVGEDDPGWDGRGHFFAAAAESMRQILVDRARRKYSLKRGGGMPHLDVDDIEVAIPGPADELLDLDRALTRLEAEYPEEARVVLLRHFAGLDRTETAQALGLSLRTMDRKWEFARAWLHRALREDRKEEDDGR